MAQLVNLFFTWWCWRMSRDAFESNHPNWGWLMLAVSAANAASFLAVII